MDKRRLNLIGPVFLCSSAGGRFPCADGGQFLLKYGFFAALMIYLHHDYKAGPQDGKGA